MRGPGPDKFEWAVKNPIVIRNGHMLVLYRSGLGMELNQDFLKAQSGRQ